MDQRSPSIPEVFKLAAESLCDPATVRRAYRDPRSVRESSWARIASAARKLGVTPPPVPEAHAS
jgi:hypothetical protein